VLKDAYTVSVYEILKASGSLDIETSTAAHLIELPGGRTDAPSRDQVPNIDYWISYFTSDPFACLRILFTVADLRSFGTLFELSQTEGDYDLRAFRRFCVSYPDAARSMSPFAHSSIKATKLYPEVTRYHSKPASEPLAVPAEEYGMGNVRVSDNFTILVKCVNFEVPICGHLDMGLPYYRGAKIASDRTCGNETLVNYCATSMLEFFYTKDSAEWEFWDGYSSCSRATVLPGGEVLIIPGSWYNRDLIYNALTWRERALQCINYVDKDEECPMPALYLLALEHATHKPLVRYSSYPYKSDADPEVAYLINTPACQEKFPHMKEKYVSAFRRYHEDAPFCRCDSVLIPRLAASIEEDFSDYSCLADQSPLSTSPRDYYSVEYNVNGHKVTSHGSTILSSHSLQNFDAMTDLAMYSSVLPDPDATFTISSDCREVSFKSRPTLHSRAVVYVLQTNMDLSNKRRKLARYNACRMNSRISDKIVAGRHADVSPQYGYHILDPSEINGDKKTFEIGDYVHYSDLRNEIFPYFVIPSAQNLLVYRGEPVLRLARRFLDTPQQYLPPYAQGAHDCRLSFSLLSKLMPDLLSPRERKIYSLFVRSISMNPKISRAIIVPRGLISSITFSYRVLGPDWVNGSAQFDPNRCNYLTAADACRHGAFVTFLDANRFAFGFILAVPVPFVRLPCLIIGIVEDLSDICFPDLEVWDLIRGGGPHIGCHLASVARERINYVASDTFI